ncbi:MAG: rhodanese-like domain-containing protein [Proteobacteria bacterium]|nr:rhodanese-like domain-containing protein [Pseudomonadota bacterium]
MRITLLLVLIACSGSSSDQGVAVEVSEAVRTKPTVDRTIAHIDVKGLKAKIDAGESIQLVDVRNIEEQLTGMVPGALSIPLHEYTPSMPPISTTDPKVPIYFICESGARSTKAAEMTSQAGFLTVNVDGGTAAWREAGFILAK